jgi:hypothetical protein
MKTEIRHIKVDSQASAEMYHRLQIDGWKRLCDGSNDSRLTGGTWLFIGNELEAKTMHSKRWAEIKASSERFYAQKWI